MLKCSSTVQYTILSAINTIFEVADIADIKISAMYMRGWEDLRVHSVIFNIQRILCVMIKTIF